MSEIRDALLYFDLDKGAADVGPLFEEPRRRLDADPALRAGWQQFQALRALAWEAAPDPGERLIRQALAESRRERVKQQLARSVGSEDLAREILLGNIKERRGLPPLAWVLVLAAGALAAWLLLGPQIQALIWPERSLALRNEAPAAVAAPAEEAPLAFEFSAPASPAQAALSAPADGSADTDDVKKDVPAARSARKLLREHLQAQSEPTATPVPTLAPRRAPPERPKPKLVVLAPIKPTATAPATVAPTAVPSLAPTAVPTTAAQASNEASFSLSTPTLKPGASLRITLNLPERKDVDLRLFDQRGRPVRNVHTGDLGPGELKLSLEAKDEAGKALAPGTYYLRVMTAWFSRVEPVEVTEQGGN